MGTILGTSGLAADEKPMLIFAAASLQGVMDEARMAIGARLGIDITVSLASSSALARQIAAGAPADLFLSANRPWVEYTVQNCAAKANSVRPVAANRLVIVRARGAAKTPRPTPGAFGGSMAAGWTAIGHPQTVPVGIYARQALTWLGVWQRLQGRLAYAANARAALALVERGQADFGIVYATDARASDAVETIYRFEQAAHDRILYFGAIVAGGKEARARAVLDYLTGPQGWALFRRHGFESPG